MPCTTLGVKDTAAGEPCPALLHPNWEAGGAEGFTFKHMNELTLQILTNARKKVKKENGMESDPWWSAKVS